MAQERAAERNLTGAPQVVCHERWFANVVCVAEQKDPRPPPPADWTGNARSNPPPCLSDAAETEVAQRHGLQYRRISGVPRGCAADRCPARSPQIKRKVERTVGKVLPIIPVRIEENGSEQIARPGPYENLSFDRHHSAAAARVVEHGCRRSPLDVPDHAWRDLRLGSRRISGAAELKIEVAERRLPAVISRRLRGARECGRIT